MPALTREMVEELTRKLHIGQSVRIKSIDAIRSVLTPDSETGILRTVTGLSVPPSMLDVYAGTDATIRGFRRGKILLESNSWVWDYTLIEVIQLDLKDLNGV